MTYEQQLLEAICDKLGIDYSEMKAAHIERVKAAREEREAKSQAAEKERREKWEKLEAARKEREEAYKPKPVSEADRASVELAYIKTEKEAKAAHKAWLYSEDNSLRKAELFNEYKELAKKARKLEVRLYPEAV